MRVGAGFAVLHTAVGQTMLALQGNGSSCYLPDWPCLSINEVAIPTPGAGQALVKMLGTSVNPIDVDLVHPGCEQLAAIGLGCKSGTVGTDGAGVIVESSCSDFVVGDEVWGNIGAGYAEYSVVSCNRMAKKPRSLSFVDAGALGVVAGTAYQCLSSLGLPSRSNATVVIMSGQGGTGSMAIQIAKAMGATTVITAASGAGIDYVKSLGADVVVDYHVEGIFDALSDDSVDFVFDNFGVPGTADKAMPAIRAGGGFLVLLGGNGGKISENPKEGVNQVSFMFQTAGTPEFAAVADYFDAGKLQPATAATYSLRDVPLAFTDKEHGHFFGKLAIDPSNLTLSDVVV